MICSYINIYILCTFIFSIVIWWLFLVQQNISHTWSQGWVANPWRPCVCKASCTPAICWSPCCFAVGFFWALWVGLFDHAKVGCYIMLYNVILVDNYLRILWCGHFTTICLGFARWKMWLSVGLSQAWNLWAPNSCQDTLSFWSVDPAGNLTQFNIAMDYGNSSCKIYRYGIIYI